MLREWIQTLPLWGQIAFIGGFLLLCICFLVGFGLLMDKSEGGGKGGSGGGGGSCGGSGGGGGGGGCGGGGE